MKNNAKRLLVALIMLVSFSFVLGSAQAVFAGQTTGTIGWSYFEGGCYAIAEINGVYVYTLNNCGVAGWLYAAEISQKPIMVGYEDAGHLITWIAQSDF